MFQSEPEEHAHSHGHMHLCTPGTMPSSSICTEYDSASPFFNCSVDYSLGNYQGNFTFGLNITEECSPSTCTCCEIDTCNYCQTSDTCSTLSLPSLVFRVSHNRKQNKYRVNRDEQKLTVLRGVLKTPKFYRTTKMRCLNEALIFSMKRCSATHPSPTRTYSRKSRFPYNVNLEARNRSYIPISSAISAMLNAGNSSLEMSIEKTVEDFGTFNINFPEIKNESSEDNNIVSLTNFMSATTLGRPDYEEELCSKLHDMEPVSKKTDLNAVNNLLTHLDTFTVSSTKF